MIFLASIITRFEHKLAARYGQQMLPSHYRALAAMKHCRTATSPRMEVACGDCQTDCQTRQFVPHSCGHRACPHCQHHESEQWIQRQLQRLVPGEYFLVTFTLPAEFRSLAWHHQRMLYDALMKSSWATLRSFAENDHQLKGTPGAIAVLHTHSRRLDYHPHVHVVMPAAALHRKKRLWRSKATRGKKPYLFNHKALAKVFRAKVLDAITTAGLALPSRHPEKWVVDCQAVGTGAKALVYLGRYLYRGVIREDDIVSCQDGQVTFRYRDSKTHRWQTRSLPGADFLRLVLQHVLPRRFRRTRNFGFLHPNSKRLIQLLQLLLKVDLSAVAAWFKPRPTRTCPNCGGAMKVLRTRLAPAPTKDRHPPLGATGCPVM